MTNQTINYEAIILQQVKKSCPGNIDKFKIKNNGVFLQDTHGQYAEIPLLGLSKNSKISKNEVE